MRIAKFIFFIAFPFIANGQGHFGFNDSTFFIGQTAKFHVIINLSGKPSVHPSSYSTMDSIVSFLKQNKHICVEFGVHLKFIGDSDFTRRVTENWAKCMYAYVLDYGIDSARITYHGYGNDTLIYVDEKIHAQHKFLKIGQALNEEYYQTLDDNKKRQVVFNLNFISEMKITNANWR